MSDEILSAILTAKERKRYAECKEVIRDALKSSWLGGEALREVRDGRYYREDFASFEEFCQTTYNMTRRYANYLIEAVEIKEDVADRSPEAAKLITHESQARELANVPEEKRAAILKQLAKEDEPITASAIRQKAESVLDTNTLLGQNRDKTAGNNVPTSKTTGVSKEPLQLDETGYKLTLECLPFWNRRQEVQDLLTLVSKAKSAMEKAVGGPDKDQLYWNVGNCIIIDLSKAYTALTNAKPYAVCPDCRGRGKKCSYCGGTGMLSKWAWDRTEKLKKDKR